MHLLSAWVAGYSADGEASKGAASLVDIANAGIRSTVYLTQYDWLEAALAASILF